MLSGALIRAFDFLFVLRPLILIPAWSFFLLGAAEGAGGVWAVHSRLPSPSVMWSLTAILVCAYLLNQIFDRESDEKNRKCFFIAQGIFRARTLITLALVFFVAASITFQKVGAQHRTPLVVALVLSLVYSLPPLRLCARPFLDLLANGVGYGGIAFALGYASYGPVVPDAVRLSLPYVLLVGSTFLHTAILDVEGDRAIEKITTAVYLGERRSAVLACILHAAAIASAVFVSNLVAVAVTVVTFPIATFSAFRRNRQASSLLVQANTLAVTLAAILSWPYYLVILVPLVAAARYYYRKRFGIIYPGVQRSA